MGQFLGYVGLNNTITGTIIYRDGSMTPKNPSTSTYRVYGPNGLVSGATGNLSQRDTGSITAATKANPCVITSAGHGLSTGTVISITGVAGMAQLNGNDYTITRVDANSFSLNSTDSTAYGQWSSGGTWNVTGLYYYSLTPTLASGYDVGNRYDVLKSGAVSSVAKADIDSFIVV